MLVISAEQIDALQELKMDNFFLSTLCDLRKVYPNYCRDNDDLALASIARKIDGARNWGLKSEKDLFLFCVFTTEYGDDFHRNPDMTWVAHILQDFLGDKMLRIIDKAIDVEENLQ